MLTDLLYSLILSFSLLGIIISFVCFLLSVAFLTGLERITMGGIQRRKGPNTAGLWGILQPFSDGIKLFSKAEAPISSSSYFSALPPFVALFVSFTVGLFFIAPFSLPSSSSFCSIYSLSIFIVLFLFCFNMFVPLLVIGTNNRYSLLGVLRSFTQMFCFEILITWCFVATSSLYETIDLREIVVIQHAILSNVSGFSDMVGLLVCLFIFMLLELNRVPFDVAEEESVTVAGIFTEYGGFNFAAFFLGEYLMMIVSSVLIACFFNLSLRKLVLFKSVLPDIVVFGLTVLLILFLILFLRATLPRVRPDHILWLGWIVSIPLSTIFFLFSLG